MEKRHIKKIRTKVVDLCYRSIGNGPDNLILIHGLAANMGFWNPLLVVALSRKFKVTLLDLRGHGYSSMPGSGYRAIDMRDDLLSLMDHLEIDRAHLAGHSFGGTVALHCALAQPERIASLALIDSRLKELQPHQRLIDWPNWQQVKKDLEAVGLDTDEYRENIGLVLLEKFASQDWKEMRKKLSGEALFVPFGGRSTGERLAKQWLQLLNETTAREDFNRPDDLPTEALSRLRMPILGYYGENSRCMTTCNRLREVWPGCALNIVPQAGHFFPATQPQAVADTLAEFIIEQSDIQTLAPAAPASVVYRDESARRPVPVLEEEAPA